MQEFEKILEEIELEKKRSSLSRDCSNEYAVAEISLLEKIGKIIRKHMNDGWIPVEEALPEKNGIYLVDDRGCGEPWIHTAGFEMRSKSWCENHGLYFDDIYGRYEDNQIIAWQYLPRPYEPGRRDAVERESNNL